MYGVLVGMPGENEGYAGVGGVTKACAGISTGDAVTLNPPPLGCGGVIPNVVEAERLNAWSAREGGV